jgi:hypothetical protein
MPEPQRTAIARRILLEWARRYAGLAIVIVLLVIVVVVAPTTSP